MRALLSVYYKDGLVDFARGLEKLGFELVSSGGTATALREAGVAVIDVSEVTGSPEMPGGLVKTLHPAIHGGILYDRETESQALWLIQQNVLPIGLVVCNLYPFRTSPSKHNIDIGGPTMVRAAAKNWEHVGIVVDPTDYPHILEELQLSADQTLSNDTRRRLARQAFAHTAAYDAAVVAWMDGGGSVDEIGLPPSIHLTLERATLSLRYGENPHQTAAVYRVAGENSWLDSVRVLSQGMTLGYLNLNDADAAWRLVHSLGSDPTVAIIKHANPCGFSEAADTATAYSLAYDCDPKSAFGGIVAFNRPVDIATAAKMVENAQADVVIAPGYSPEAVQMLVNRRKNTRILIAKAPTAAYLDYRQIDGAFLVQEAPHYMTWREDWKVVTHRQPTRGEWHDAEVAWRLQDHTKSNSIIYVKGGTAWGIGVGQQNRHDSAVLAGQKAAGRAAGGAASSDAFFPFRDGLDEVVKAGVAVVIQPGGAMRDQEVIDAANEHGIAMVFTGERHFRH